MEKLSLQKFESYFKKTKNLVTPESFLNSYININKTISEILYLKRVKTIENSFEKISYKILKEDKRFGKYYYIGIYKTKTNLYQFDFYSDNLLSARELKKKISHIKSFYHESNFKSLLNSFEHKLTNKIESFSNKLNKFEVKKEFKDYFKANSKKYNIKLDYYDQPRILESIISYRKEENHFKLRYLNNVVKSYEKEKLQNFVYENYDKELITLNKNIFSNFNGYTFNKIKEKIDQVGIETLKSFYKRYPLLIVLYLGAIDQLPTKEKEIAINFYKTFDKNISFMENIKKYFILSDSDIQNLEGLSWQKFTSLKNRPIMLLSLVRFKINLSNIKTRKQMHSLYIYFNYFHNSPYFCFEEKPDYDKIIKFNLKKNDFLALKNIASTHFLELSKDIPVMAFKRDIRVKYKSFESFLMKYRISELGLNPLKSKIEINGVEYKTTMTNMGSFISNTDETRTISISIDLISKDDLEIRFLNVKGFSDIELIEFKNKILNEFNRFHNKKFPISKIIDKRFFFDYLYYYDKDKKIACKKYYFCPKLSIVKKSKKFKIDKLEFNKERKSLIDVI